MKKDSWTLALRVMANLSGWIVAPVIMGVVIGKWLDKKFNTEPWLFLGAIGFCFLISMYGLIINALKEFKKIEKEYEENKKENSKENK